MPTKIVLSHFQTRELLPRRREPQTLEISLNLGLTTSQVRLDEAGATFPGEMRLDWDTILEIDRHPANCFVVEGQTATKIQRYSERLQRVYSLMPTAGAPTLLLSGFPMHRIKDTEPHQDTLAKIRTLAPIRGPVLDTATGLGYTAIQAAETADWVVTIELDPTALEIAHLNPWSQALFGNRRIQPVIGDAAELLPAFPARAFARIVHDPPTFSLAGDLYSLEFYRQLFRVLRPGGRLFHYVGNLSSPAGRRVVRGVVRRLKGAGFERVTRRPEAYGVVAYKS